MRQLRRQVPVLLRFYFVLRIVDHSGAAPIYCAVRFRNLLTAFGLVIMALCASAGQTPSGGESGIEGVITISPARPGPTRVDAPGSVPLANVTFAVENDKGEVASFTTDGKGHFRAA